MNWIGFCGKERTGKTGICIDILCNDNDNQIWLIDFDMEGDE